MTTTTDDEPSTWAERRTRDRLMEQYWYEGLSREQIADEWGQTTGSVQTWLDKRDVPMRSLADSQRLRQGTVRLADLRREYGIEDPDDEPAVEWTRVL